MALAFKPTTKRTVKGAALGGLAGLLLAVGVYVYFVFLTTYPPGQEGNGFMSAGYFIGAMGMPLHWVLVELTPYDPGAVIDYSIYLLPVLINGAILGALAASVRRVASPHSLA